MSAAAFVSLSEVPYLSLKPLSLSGRLDSLLIELSALSMGHSQLLLQVPSTHPQLLHLQVHMSVMSHVCHPALHDLFIHSAVEHVSQQL